MFRWLQDQIPAGSVVMAMERVAVLLQAVPPSIELSVPSPKKTGGSGCMACAMAAGMGKDMSRVNCTRLQLLGRQ